MEVPLPVILVHHPGLLQEVIEDVAATGRPVGRAGCSDCSGVTGDTAHLLIFPCPPEYEFQLWLHGLRHVALLASISSSMK